MGGINFNLYINFLIKALEIKYILYCVKIVSNLFTYFDSII